MNGNQSGDSNFVSQALAEALASKITTNYFENGDTNAIGNRLLNHTIVIKDIDSLPALYIINYAMDSGYVVISADFRYAPILSYVKSNNIHVGDTLPSMLVAWFEYSLESIEGIRYGQIDNAFEGYSSWSGTVNNLGINPGAYQLHWPTQWELSPDFAGGCNDATPFHYKAIVYPLLQTTWGQGANYNNLISLNCPADPSGKAPTGCVAVAMAQLIRYWEATTFTTYDYSIMPNHTGNYEVQRLMYDCGDKVNMDYGCDGSAAYSNVALNELATNFGFERGAYNYLSGRYQSTSIKRDYEDVSDFEHIKHDINNNRVVYLDGCRERTRIIFFYVSSKCHAWLTDGYREWGNRCRTDRYLHMNWGWDGKHNSYYYYNSWSSTAGNYQFRKQYYTNIHP